MKRIIHYMAVSKGGSHVSFCTMRLPGKEGLYANGAWPGVTCKRCKAKRNKLPLEAVPPSQPVMQIGAGDIELLKSLKRGADIYGYAEGRRLRELQKGGCKLFQITKAMCAPSDGAKQQPYFGAILTKEGQEFLELLKPSKKPCEHRKIAKLNKGALGNQCPNCFRWLDHTGKVYA